MYYLFLNPFIEFTNRRLRLMAEMPAEDICKISNTPKCLLSVLERRQKVLTCFFLFGCSPIKLLLFFIYTGNQITVYSICPVP